MALEIKRDPYVWRYAALLVAILGGLIWHKDITIVQAIALAGAALGLPGMIGRTEKPDEKNPNSIITLTPPPMSSEVTVVKIDNTKESGER